MPSVNADPVQGYQPPALCNVAGSPRQRWSIIAGRTVYFGHQSIGSAVVSGVEELAQEHLVPLRVVHAHDPATVTGPAIVHFLSGQNRDYASKNATVLRLLESQTRARSPVLLLKYCYVDLNSPADSHRMFEAYHDTVEAIRFEHPDVTVVHATIPLTTVEGAIKSGAMQFAGRPTRREAAIARHRYNELLRAEFADLEPIFDLAKVEAKQLDGTLAGFIAGGSVIETLAQHNTDDGSHLNARCRRAAAENLLDVLSGAIEAVA
jgi:hypothetical protein